MNIELELKYPLHLRRYGDGTVVIVDSGWTEVAKATEFSQAYELVRLANYAYKLVSDLSLKPPGAGQPRNLGLNKKDPDDENPAKTPDSA